MEIFSSINKIVPLTVQATSKLNATLTKSAKSNGNLTTIDANDSTWGRITIHHLDENSISITPNEVKIGNINDSFMTDKLKIDGYRFKEFKGTKTGKFKDEGQDVFYIYIKKVNEPFFLPDPLPDPQPAPKYNFEPKARLISRCITYLTTKKNQNQLKLQQFTLNYKKKNRI